MHMIFPEISGDPMEQMRKIAAARLKGYVRIDCVFVRAYQLEIICRPVVSLVTSCM